MPESSNNPTAALREHARKSLGFMMGSLLSNGEPLLISQARQARGSAEQTQLYDAIRELRLKGRSLQEHFVAGVLAAFDEAAQPKPATPSATPPREVDKALALDSLGVVKDAHLEQQIAVDNIANRASHQYREVLLSIGRQLARSSGNRRVELESLPIGPQKLAVVFMESCSRGGVEPGAMLVFSRLFTRFIVDELGPFYHECVELFPPEAETELPLSGVPEDAPRATPSLVTAIAKPIPAEPEKPATDAAWDASRTPLVLPPGKAMAMPRNQLEEALADLQESLLDPAKTFFSPNPKGGIQPLRIPELLNDALSEAGLKRPMSLSADVVEAMGLIKLLFEHALGDSRVPPAIRRVMRLLEVPFLRLALREPEMLSGATHPARVLFTEIGMAAAGRSAASDAASEDFSRLVQLLVMRVLGDYDKDSSVFETALQELRRYLSVHGGGPVPTAKPEPGGIASPQPPQPAPRPAAPAPAAPRPPASPEFHVLVDKIPLDGWIELRPQGGARRRLQLLGRAPRTGALIFADASGEKAGEWSRNDLASMIENAEAVILKSGATQPPGRR